MKKMYLICGFAICSATLFNSCNQNQVDASREESDQDGQDVEYVQPVIWTGPGWYSGVWFSTEIDFNTWNHHHYRRNRDRHGRYNDHHDRHRDGHRDGARSRDGGGGGHHERGRR